MSTTCLSTRHTSVPCEAPLNPKKLSSQRLSLTSSTAKTIMYYTELFSNLFPLVCITCLFIHSLLPVEFKLHEDMESMVYFVHYYILHVQNSACHRGCSIYICQRSLTSLFICIYPILAHIK